MNSARGPKINVGSVTIVVIFTVTCLTIFALLSLSTARSEQKLSLKSAEAVTAYYAADNAATRKVNALAELNGVGMNDQPQAAKDLGMDIAQSDAGMVYSFTESVDDSSTLSVRFLISQDKTRILEWKVVNAADWLPDNTLPVWTGDE